MRPLALALLVLCLSPVPGVRAGIVTTLLAEGQVTEDQSQDGSPTSKAYHFEVGETVHLALTYNFYPGDQPPKPTPGQYWLSPASFRVWSSGGYEFGSSSTGGTLSVTDGPVDRLSFQVGGAYSNIWLVAEDRTGMALSSTSLPTVAEFNAFGSMSMRLTFYSDGVGGDPGFVARMSPVTTAAVPEPASVATVGLGVIMAFGYAWRRRRRAA